MANEELSVQEKADRMRELTNLYGTKRSIKQVELESLNCSILVLSQPSFTFFVLVVTYNYHEKGLHLFYLPFFPQ